MPKINVKKAFDHSDDGIVVAGYQPGVQDVSEECAKYALASGKAVAVSGKAKGVAPENKAKTGQDTKSASKGGKEK